MTNKQKHKNKCVISILNIFFRLVSKKICLDKLARNLQTEDHLFLPEASRPTSCSSSNMPPEGNLCDSRPAAHKMTSSVKRRKSCATQFKLRLFTALVLISSNAQIRKCQKAGVK